MRMGFERGSFLFSLSRSLTIWNGFLAQKEVQHNVRNVVQWFHAYKNRYASIYLYI